MSQQHEQIASEVADALDDIRELFKPPVKITILVRMTEQEDFFMTDDDLESVAKAITQRIALGLQ